MLKMPMVKFRNNSRLRCFKHCLHFFHVWLRPWASYFTHERSLNNTRHLLKTSAFWSNSICTKCNDYSHGTIFKLCLWRPKTTMKWLDVFVQVSQRKYSVLFYSKSTRIWGKRTSRLKCKLFAEYRLSLKAIRSANMKQQQFECKRVIINWNWPRSENLPRAAIAQEFIFRASVASLRTEWITVLSKTGRR